MVEIAIGDNQRLGRTTAVAVDLVGKVIDRARGTDTLEEAAAANFFCPRKSDH
jgi:hypothetical protein